MYRDLNFGLSLHLYPYCMCASIEGSDEFYAYAGRQCDRRQNLKHGSSEQ